MSTTLYGDLNPEIAGAFAKKILEISAPTIIMGQFGQSETMAEHNTELLNFTRYVSVDSEPANLPLGETVSPNGKKLESELIQTRLVQYGDHIKLSEKQLRLGLQHVLDGAQKVMSRQASELSEKVILNAVKAGTSVFYANGASRSAVNAVASTVTLNSVIEFLNKQNAPLVTKRLNPVNNYATEPVRAGFIAVIPPELVAWVRSLTGFIDSRKYPAPSEFGAHEIGAWNDIRFIKHSLMTRFSDLGATGGTNVRQDTATSKALVYPVVVFGEEAFCQVALSGEFAITPYYVAPKPQISDPQGQVGLVGWNSYRVAAILNDMYIARIETAAPNNV